MRTAAAWSFPCGSCFFVGRRLRCCSNPPLRRFTNFRIKQKLQCHYNTGVLGGRGWITQAAHLKRPRRGLFAAGTYSGGRCCSNPPLRRFTNFQIKQKLQHLYDAGVLGGRGWMSQAALLKTARWAVFALSSATAPQLFESTRHHESDVYAKENRQCISTPAVFSWARVDSNHRS